MNLSPINRLLFALFCLLVLISISGCDTTPKEKIVYQTKVVYQVVSEDQLRTITPQRPMDKASYLALTCPAREAYLGEYVLGLHKDIQSCNAQITSIQKDAERLKALSHENQPSR